MERLLEEWVVFSLCGAAITATVTMDTWEMCMIYRHVSIEMFTFWGMIFSLPPHNPGEGVVPPPCSP